MFQVTRIVAMTQAGALRKQQILLLEEKIRNTFENHFGSSQTLVFVWLTIPAGQAYLAGKPSNASTLQIPVADGLSDEKRHHFMHKISEEWMQITQCDKHEIILNAPDASEAKRQFIIFNEKFRESRRASAQIKMLSKLLVGRVFKGYLTTSING